MLLVICNFYGNRLQISLPDNLVEGDGQILIANYDDYPVFNKYIELRPYEAIVYRIITKL